MKMDWQTVGALLIVAVTVILLVRSGLKRRRSGGGCPGCREKVPTAVKERKSLD